MNKLFLFSVALAFVSCAMPAEDAEVKGVGFFKPMPEETFIAGSDEITEIWNKYIEAHNNGDLEAIKSMSADSIFILGPDGTVIRTKEQQAGLLEGWFAASNPKWDTYWAMPYKSVPGGADWIIAGHSVSETVDGEESFTRRQMIDAEIRDGKVFRFFVYESLPAKADAAE